MMDLRTTWYATDILLLLSGILRSKGNELLLQVEIRMPPSRVLEMHAEDLRDCLVCLLLLELTHALVSFGNLCQKQYQSV